VRAAAEWRQALVAAGANLGDRWAQLSGAIGALRAEARIRAVEVSRVYETEPVGPAGQPMFLNLVLGLETTLSPEELLAELQRLERAAGRERVVRWGPRTLDLDLLAFEGETRDGPALTLPHPRIEERAFVTVPLRDVLARARFRRAAWAGWRERLEELPRGPGVSEWRVEGA